MGILVKAIGDLATLAVAIEASIQAGDYFRTRLDTEKQVKTKSSPSDLVTDVDPECERMIRARILADFPDHQILGEESTAPGATASAEAIAEVMSEASLWIVDPLDGTTNFVCGMPLSTVSLAFAEEGELVTGVIYDPYRREVFYAVRGRGAWLADAQAAMEWASNPVETTPGRRLQVTEVNRLEESIVATGFPTRGPSRVQTTKAALAMAERRVKSMRALGSAALHLAYVASGRLDAFWEFDLNAWDLAAGVLLVTEAGGCVHSLDGADYELSVRDVVASGNGELAKSIEIAVQSI